MHAFASPDIIAYVNASNALPDYPSSVNSGILGDPGHYLANSYHIPIHHLPNPNGYTNFHPDDKAPPGSWSRDHASADDMSMSTADMIKQWNRYLAVFNNRHNDPRAKYIAEYIGWNGVGSAERLDFVTGSRTNASEDHKWHAHRANRRKYHNSQAAFAARLSVDKGETIAQYLGGTMAGLLDQEAHANRLVWRVQALVGMEPNVADSGTPPEPNDLVTFLLALDAKLTAVAAAVNAPVVVELSPAQVSAIAQEIIAADTNELSAGDLASIEALVVEGAKRAAREGSGTGS